MALILSSIRRFIFMILFSIFIQLAKSAPTLTVSRLYSAMREETMHMFRETFSTYSQFETLRVGHTMSSNWYLTGLPNHLSWTYAQRHAASEADVLETHVSNLLIFERALRYMEADEQTYSGSHSFRTNFRAIRSKLNTLIAGLQHIMDIENLVGINQTPVTSTLIFSPNADDEEINRRDLIVLRELAHYSPVLSSDINRLSRARSG
ncbi:uncharacterized protein [Antedon mediterranea]|uniref:uncharacterized protein n=1 Tax=Antedon mediterranea TaxID=105859 RepID=UPI003AF7EEF1